MRRYNTVMKLVFLVSSATIVYYMRFHRVVRNTYDKEVDTFRVAFLVGPCLLFALLINQEFTLLEVRTRAAHVVIPVLFVKEEERSYWHQEAMQLCMLVLLHLSSWHGPGAVDVFDLP